jgi:hypothetical protein
MWSEVMLKELSKLPPCFLLRVLVAPHNSYRAYDVPSRDPRSRDTLKQILRSYSGGFGHLTEELASVIER